MARARLRLDRPEKALASLGRAWRPSEITETIQDIDTPGMACYFAQMAAVRNNRWEIRIAKRFLKDGVFHLQQLQSVPIVRLQKKIGELAAEEFRAVRSKLSELLHLA
jgi:hypothetical protein